MLSCEYCEIFKNSYFEERLQTNMVYAVQAKTFTQTWSSSMIQVIKLKILSLWNLAIRNF